jgi:hypothetical protein
MLDVGLPGDVNLLTGFRYDRSHARNVNLAGRFNINTGNSGLPGAFQTSDDIAAAWDGGPSWSLSLSREIPGGLHPYVTAARSSIMLDGNNNSLLNSVIRAGHVGAAQMQELGLKGSWQDGAVTLSTAAFRQGRIDVSTTDDPNILAAYATATTTQGWQSELRWIPGPRLMLGAYALRQVTRYTPNAGAVLQLDARALGFQDVVDATGRVIYPAEAFLYGGRARIVLPAGVAGLDRKQGNPETQVGLSGVLQLSRRWGLTIKANYLSETCAGRLCLVTLPSAFVSDIGLFRSGDGLEFKLDVSNVFDTHYFRARTGDTLGDVIAQTLPGRRWQLTARYRF